MTCKPRRGGQSLGRVWSEAEPLFLEHSIIECRRYDGIIELVPAYLRHSIYLLT